MKTLIAFTGLVGRGVGSHLYIEAVLPSATPVIALSLAVIFFRTIYSTPARRCRALWATACSHFEFTLWHFRNHNPNPCALDASLSDQFSSARGPLHGSIFTATTRA